MLKVRTKCFKEALISKKKVEEIPQKPETKTIRSSIKTLRKEAQGVIILSSPKKVSFASNKGTLWSDIEYAKLIKAIKKFGRNYDKLSDAIKSRSIN